ncbi:hypothetical protein ZWY2020_056853 [Hordeum vulgare]|nr:hypothetical protein ZWY2020_056853 [Hordeum vulgare]
MISSSPQGRSLRYKYGAPWPRPRVSPLLLSALRSPPCLPLFFCPDICFARYSRRDSEQTDIGREWAGGLVKNDPFQSTGCRLPPSIAGLYRMSLSKDAKIHHP